ncbi:alpha/beta hydrolase fold domain-containing protein [Salmonella enterica subsp. enterica]|nr:alpha/beta hydrolase fold domain-containing protein [Salmonella enterica subsp. enterica]
MPFSIVCARTHLPGCLRDDAERGANIVHQYAEQLGIDRERSRLLATAQAGTRHWSARCRLKSTAHRSLWAKLLLIHPMLVASPASPAMPATGKTTSSPAIRRYRVSEMYLQWYRPPPPGSQPSDMAKILPVCPPVHILTAEFDPLRDEARSAISPSERPGVACTSPALSRCYPFTVFQLGGVSKTAQYATWPARGHRSQTASGVRAHTTSSFPPFIRAERFRR